LNRVIADETNLQALLNRALAGDAGAYRAFLDALAGPLRAYFRARLRTSPQEAEDLLQETILALHTRRHTYDPAYPVTAWAYAIARYRLIDHWRRQGRRGVHVPLEYAADLSAPPQEHAVDARRDVLRLLAALPAKQQEAIRLVKLKELSVREAAKQLGRSESDIKVSIHRGLKAIAAGRMKGAAP
jgi:RNA polymerase sigma-70 factor (ECF subfamily)